MFCFRKNCSHNRQILRCIHARGGFIYFDATDLEPGGEPPQLFQLFGSFKFVDGQLSECLEQGVRVGVDPEVAAGNYVGFGRGALITLKRQGCTTEVKRATVVAPQHFDTTAAVPLSHGFEGRAAGRRRFGALRDAFHQSTDMIRRYERLVALDVDHERAR